MKHSISYDDWLAYLDGALEPAPSDRIRTHLSTCAECRDLYNGMLDATAVLRASGDAYRETATVTPAAIRRARDQVCRRIRTSDDHGTLEDLAGAVLTISRLRRLQALVAPVCGSRTAFRLIVAAVARMSMARGQSSGGDWNCFVQKLNDLTSAFCGKTTARLVWKLGQSLEVG